MCAWLALRCALRSSPFNRASAAAKLIAALTLCIGGPAHSAVWCAQFAEAAVASASLMQAPTRQPCRTAIAPARPHRVRRCARERSGAERPVGHGGRARVVCACVHPSVCARRRCVRACGRACVRACVSPMDLARSETSRARVQRATRGARRLRIRDSGPHQGVRVRECSAAVHGL